jgi:hypothetical protein
MHNPQSMEGIIMKAENIFQKKRILYCVDPKHLTIKMLNLIHLLNKQLRRPGGENVQAMKDSEKNALFACDSFPIEVNGIWYFESEDDARGFIKRLIGF